MRELQLDALARAMQLKSIDYEDAKSTEDAQGVNAPGRGLPRAVDVVLAVTGLLLTSPLLLASAVTVALTSPGGALFRQKRVGRHGQIFTLYKLRTMSVSGNGPQVTKGNDPRITKSGRFLRKTKLDELPTFWNVLKGDMAMVGPRPEVPRYVKLEDPLWQRVLAVRPGLTDPVTLHLRNEEQLLVQVGGDTEEYYLTELQPQKIKGYLDYLQTRNWQTDLTVLWRTLVAVVFPHRKA
jgi:lipopolysaccharide/colanic/teichoic acid biosynthesis glycosyltransferase